jgi:hypothetical protein
MPTGEALKPERDPPGVLTGRTGKKEAPWVGLPRLPSFPWMDDDTYAPVARCPDMMWRAWCCATVGQATC